ncbi:hypothetical protein [Photobacterium carnosum]|nr:hypothetical protein [Photobacterium carnosum]MCD9530292.1 hypothetical protein [Photobacterium carnosum]MCF2154290.1 hypothetical protein [Photobacterium carnosum]MCF2216142.1 hypothetical protein [Photobacterium carnosum]
MINEITKDGVKVVYLPNPTIFKRNIRNDYISSMIQGKSLSEDYLNKENNMVNNNYVKKVEMKLRLLSKHNDNFIYISKSELYKHDFFIRDSKLIPYSADGGHISILGAEELASEIINEKSKSKITNLLEQTSREKV